MANSNYNQTLSIMNENKHHSVNDYLTKDEITDLNFPFPFSEGLLYLKEKWSKIRKGVKEEMKFTQIFTRFDNKVSYN